MMKKPTKTQIMTAISRLNTFHARQAAKRLFSRDKALRTPKHLDMRERRTLKILHSKGLSYRFLDVIGHMRYNAGMSSYKALERLTDRKKRKIVSMQLSVPFTPIVTRAKQIEASEKVLREFDTLITQAVPVTTVTVPVKAQVLEPALV